MSFIQAILFNVLEDDTDMADSYISVDRFIGSGNIVSGEVSIGKNDIDTVKYLDDMGLMTEGTVLSVHNDAGSDYQNTSGFNAIAVLTIQARTTGAATRHVKVYSGPTTDTAAGATLLWEIGQQDTIFFDENGDQITTPQLTIANNHFIIVENVDDSRTGTNDMRVMGQTSTALIGSLVVERGA